MMNAWSFKWLTEVSFGLAERAAAKALEGQKHWSKKVAQSNIRSTYFNARKMAIKKGKQFEGLTDAIKRKKFYGENLYK